MGPLLLFELVERQHHADLAGVVACAAKGPRQVFDAQGMRGARKGHGDRHGMVGCTAPMWARAADDVEKLLQAVEAAQIM